MCYPLQMKDRMNKESGRADAKARRNTILIIVRMAVPFGYMFASLSYQSLLLQPDLSP